MPAHPRRSAFAKPGTSSGGWSRGTPPARRPRDETRAPATLVEATFCAIADAGSIPAVSTFRQVTGRRVRVVQRAMPKPPLPAELDEFLSQPNPSVIATLAPDGSPHTAGTWY